MKGEYEELICFKYIQIKKYKSYVRHSMMKIEVKKKKKKNLEFSTETLVTLLKTLLLYFVCSTTIT